jgi:hypothetical protein
LRPPLQRHNCRLKPKLRWRKKRKSLARVRVRVEKGDDELTIGLDSRRCVVVLALYY